MISISDILNHDDDLYTMTEDFYKKVELEETKYTEKIKKIKDSLVKALDILTPDNLFDETMRTISAKSRLIHLLQSEKATLNTIDDKLTILKGKLYNKIKTEGDIKLTDKGIEIYIEQTQKYIALNNIYKNQKNLISYLETLIAHLQNKQFAVQNLIKLKEIDRSI